MQINQVLDKLKAHKDLLKKYRLTDKPTIGLKDAYAYAKTGTLDGVRTYAGFLRVDDIDYQFVFLFNRKTPYQYRDNLLQRLAEQLAKQLADQKPKKD